MLKHLQGTETHCPTCKDKDQLKPTAIFNVKTDALFMISRITEHYHHIDRRKTNTSKSCINY